MRFLPAAALAATLSLPALGLETPQPGYQVTSLPSPATGPFFTATAAVLSSGDLVTWDGTDVVRWTASGGFVQTLASPGGPGVFASFIVPTPAEDAVIIGESTNFELYRVPLDGSGETLLGTVPLNFDARFSDATHLVVSGFDASANANAIVRVDAALGTQERIAQVPGPSGPVAVDPAGNLYYATQSAAFPPPPDSTDVLQWSSAQVAAAISSGTPLTQADAVVFAGPYDGGASMDFDPVSGRLILAENNASTGLQRIVEVTPGGDGASAPVVLNSAGSVAGLQFLSGPGAASFEAFQPSDGSHLAYRTTDFFSFLDLATLRPKRPTLGISGLGVTAGLGPVTFAVDGAQPGGTFFLLYAFQSSLQPTEQAYGFPGFLWHTVMTPGQVRRVPFYIPVDASGHGQLTFWNPGNLQGAFGWQAWVATATGAFLGSTPTETF